MSEDSVSTTDDSLFSTFLTNTIDGALIIENGRIKSCNDSFLRLLRYESRDSLTGRDLLHISAEYQTANVSSESMFHSIQKENAKNSSFRFDWLYQKADKTSLWTETTITRLDSGDATVLLLMIRDISLQMELEQEIYKRNQALEASNVGLNFVIENLAETQGQLIQSEKMANIARLVAGIAHEINTPAGISLTGITQLLEESKIVQRQYEDGSLTQDEFEDFISSVTELSEMVKGSIDKVSHLISSFKRIDITQSADEEQPVNVRTHIGDTLYCLESSLSVSMIENQIECAEDINVIIKPELLSQIISNLVINSIQHGYGPDEHGHIYISVKRESANQFTLLYKDDGCGIDAEHIHNIFSPFYTTRRKDGHIGLGLSIVYTIVTQGLGGTIEYIDNEGCGAQFLIKVRLKEAQASISTGALADAKSV